MKSQLLTVLLSAVALFGASTFAAESADELFPPAAKPGECYTRVFVPATYKTVTEEMQSKEAGSRLEIVPAKYETVNETVLVSDASVKLEIVPAEYGWEEVSVLMAPESKRLVEVPAMYETQTEKILVKAAHTAWKEGRGPVEKVDNSTGEIMCLVEVPAEYQTVTKRVLKSAAHTTEQVTPAVYKTVKKRVVKTPATTREVAIPSKYDTIPVRKLVSPATSREIQIPAQYTTVSRREQVTAGQMAWTRILCETNTTPDVVRKLQTALDRAGYAPGPIDGVIGSATMRAVASYQSAKGLPKAGLTVETLRSLNVL